MCKCFQPFFLKVSAGGQSVQCQGLLLSHELWAEVFAQNKACVHLQLGYGSPPSNTFAPGENRASCHPCSHQALRSTVGPRAHWLRPPCLQSPSAARPHTSVQGTLRKEGMPREVHQVNLSKSHLIFSCCNKKGG